ncbi:hypothetical protein GCM10011400_64060 [Paraburkholderia caffeinilytica]|uniref:Uncharacterized protein n=2 Tax=Paraburkholderia caffeinilytica TaxID=1761016 RepID=A0ABQ1NB95_9BURK|nr:hypothetical protein GCM10011400_64060 [Paraburkholderia caffeinilytica]
MAEGRRLQQSLAKRRQVCPHITVATVYPSSCPCCKITSDPVMGGPNGVYNRQTKQLANRMTYPKAQQEAHAGEVDPHPEYQTQVETQVLITAAINALVTDSSLAATSTAFVNALFAVGVQ